jgi:hypothetical protein
MIVEMRLFNISLKKNGVGGNVNEGRCGREEKAMERKKGLGR